MKKIILLYMYFIPILFIGKTFAKVADTTQPECIQKLNHPAQKDILSYSGGMHFNKLDALKNAKVLFVFRSEASIGCSVHKPESTIFYNGSCKNAEINNSTTAAPLLIIFPKNNQKVRGDYKIYGKAKPGAEVKLLITSTYYKTAHNNGERISKGEGPVNRMNRKFTITADRSGTWLLKSIELRNAGWEETFIIKATSEGRSVSIVVSDNVHPQNID